MVYRPKRLAVALRGIVGSLFQRESFPVETHEQITYDVKPRLNGLGDFSRTINVPASIQ